MGAGSKYDDYDDDPKYKRSAKAEVPLPPPIDVDYGDAPTQKPRRQRYADDDPIVDPRDAEPKDRSDKRARDRRSEYYDDSDRLKPSKSGRDDRGGSSEPRSRKPSPYGDADDEDADPRPKRKEKVRDRDRERERDKDRDRDRDRGKSRDRMPSYSPQPRERRRRDDMYDELPRRSNTTKDRNRGYDDYDDRPNPDEPETTITTVAIGQTKIAVGTKMIIVLAKTTAAGVMMTMIVIGAGMIGTAIGIATTVTVTVTVIGETEKDVATKKVASTSRTST